MYEFDAAVNDALVIKGSYLLIYHFLFLFLPFKEQSLNSSKLPYYPLISLSFESTYLHMLLSSHTVLAIYVTYGTLQFQGSQIFP